MKFKTKNGWLTPYALACGYIETVQSERYSITLEWNCGIGYDIRVHDHKDGLRLMWETYEHLTEARKIFSDRCRQFNVKRTPIK
jgi:hypothetical protein